MLLLCFFLWLLFSPAGEFPTRNRQTKAGDDSNTDFAQGLAGRFYCYPNRRNELRDISAVL